MTDIQPSLIEWLAKTTQKEVKAPSLIQSLWSGYGACFRATLIDRVNNTPMSVVAKCVQPSPEHIHPRGWQGDTSHRRKCRSFEVEHYFYTHLQARTNQACLTPTCLASATAVPNTCTQTYTGESHARLLVMSDLDSAGYTQRANGLTLAQSHAVLHWLGAFHARFMGLTDCHVWPEGTYWHLATRHDEWHQMKNGPLKEAAETLSRKLSSAQFQTLLHGDAKVANFCFTPDFAHCGGVDFQYTGLGVGIKDVAYFIGSALNENDQRIHTTSCLDIYFSSLRTHLLNTQFESCSNDIEDEWRSLYPLACADFNRFLAGWSPNHWKINGELTRQTHIALATLG